MKYLVLLFIVTNCYSAINITPFAPRIKSNTGSKVGKLVFPSVIRKVNIVTNTPRIKLIWDEPNFSTAYISYNVYYKNSLSDSNWLFYTSTTQRQVLTPFTNKMQFFWIRSKDKDLPQESH